MQWWEVNRYLSGINRRKRTAWETSREIVFILATINWDRKKCAPPNSPKDMMPFPWEKDEPQAPEITEEEIREMQELMREMKF